MPNFVGTAYPSGICGPDACSWIFASYSMGYAAGYTLSHEMGHSLGMGHDDEYVCWFAKTCCVRNIFFRVNRYF